MRSLLITACLLLMAMNACFAQQAYSSKEFKPLHGLTGLWKMEMQRGTLYEEWTMITDNRIEGSKDGTAMGSDFIYSRVH